MKIKRRVMLCSSVETRKRKALAFRAKEGVFCRICAAPSDKVKHYLNQDEYWKARVVAGDDDKESYSYTFPESIVHDIYVGDELVQVPFNPNYGIMETTRETIQAQIDKEVEKLEGKEETKTINPVANKWSPLPKQPEHRQSSMVGWGLRNMLDNLRKP